MADVVAGRYELGQLIGTGGNGRVFAARDRVLDRFVAVKLVDAEAVRHRDPAGRERFLDEARSSAGFIHPNAVAVFDAGESDGSLYLVMELVEGETLADRLATQGPMEPATAARVASDVLAALDAAHRSGIVHRDVKPANVLLDAHGTAKLADFGIAKRLDTVAASLTSPGQFFGTPKYLAPEQVDGRPVSAATDVYAMGVVLFEMLSGRPPFDESQPMATAIAQRDAPVPDLRVIRPDLPPTLVGIVERALRKDPDDRFESAAAMRAALTSPLWPAPPSVADPTVAIAPPPVDPTAVLAAPGAAAHAPVSPRVESPTVAHGPSVAAPFGGEHRRRGPARTITIALAVIALVALVLALVLRSSDGELPTDADTVPGVVTVPGASVDPGSAPVDPGAVTTLPAVVDPALPIVLPSDVPMLIDYVAADPSSVGERGEDLLAGLRDVVDRKGKKQREAAEELSEEIGEWTEDGELDAGIASLAQQLLERLAQTGDEEDGD